MGDRVVGLCNFCEVHGPRVVFVNQESSGSNGQRRICNKQFYGDVNLDLLGSIPVLGEEAATASSSTADTCQACRSSDSSKPAYLSNDHSNRISYVGCQYPFRIDVFSRVRCACVRSLSCESCPGRQGPIVFGDSTNGYCLCYVFTLKDSKARGFQHSYSIIVATRQLDELIRNYRPLVAKLKSVVARLQTWSDRVFDRERTESVDRMPQIAASGRAGWMPSGFFLRSGSGGGGGGGGPVRVVSAPRSLAELTDRPDVFRSLHECFVEIHHTASANLVHSLLGDDCSIRSSGENGVFLIKDATIDDLLDNKTIDDGVMEENGGGHCHICSACTINPTSSSPSLAFRTLTLLYDRLGWGAFSLLVYHLLIGNQVVVRSSCVCSNRMLLDALKLLLPPACIKCVDSSREYRESWEFNLVGLLTDTTSSSPADCLRNGLYSKLSTPPSNNDSSFRSLSNSIGGEDGCVILSVEFNPNESRNGNLMDYSGHLIPPPPSSSSAYGKDGRSTKSLDGYHFRVSCTASASSNNHLDCESPALLQSVLNLLSTVYSRFFQCDEGVAGGLAVLDSLKDEWLTKAKLYYVMSMKYRRSDLVNDGDDSWRENFFRLSKCTAVDEAILKFWRTGLDRRFKQSVLSQHSAQIHSPSSSSTTSHQQHCRMDTAKMTTSGNGETARIRNGT